ncbi:hypothetical protein LBMAG53_14220 [Planctomycetota bacterium]|nr:hypothetical protein LBMAG53_14220 [Planctomycetota bacterium]
MQVVHVIARLNDGGPARVIAALAGMLPDWRHHVLHGICPPGEPDISERVEEAGATTERLPGLGRTPGLGDLVALAALIDRLRTRRPDLIHTHTAKAGVLGRIAARWLGLPCLHTYHGHVLQGYFHPLVNAGVAAAESAVAGRHHHHALTPGQAHELRDHHGIGHAARWHVLPIPIPTPPVLPRPARTVPVIGFLGRLAPVKDIGLWLKTLREVRRSHAVDGLVCGTGTDRAWAEANAADLPVRFAGTTPTAHALAGMDVLLMTSRNEGLPLAAVEAMAAGVPVVAPAVGGLADLARIGAVRTAERTAPALAAAVIAALSQPAPAAAAAFASLVTPDALAADWGRLYAAVAGRDCFAAAAPDGARPSWSGWRSYC